MGFHLVWFITEELGLSDDSCDIHLEGSQLQSVGTTVSL
jgi:hypothetical protein